MSYSSNIFLIGVVFFIIFIGLFVAGIFIGAEMDGSYLDQKYGDESRSIWNTMLLFGFSVSIIAIIIGLILGKYVENN